MENVTRSETSNIQLVKKRFSHLYQKHIILYNNNALNKSARLFPSINFFIVDKTFELTNWEDKSIRELPCVNSSVPED
jgi:hypothetical protein